MTALGEVPMMVRGLEGLDQPRHDLRICQVTGDELMRHADLAARGFGAPKEVFVATPPEFQGRGYGAAVTTAAMTRAHRSGATWAWLQSSPAGYPVYQRLGFRELEAWPTWISA